MQQLSAENEELKINKSIRKCKGEIHAESMNYTSHSYTDVFNDNIVYVKGEQNTLSNLAACKNTCIWSGIQESLACFSDQEMPG